MHHSENGLKPGVASRVVELAFYSHHASCFTDLKLSKEESWFSATMEPDPAAFTTHLTPDVITNKKQKFEQKQQ